MSLRNQIYVRRFERKRGHWEYVVSVAVKKGDTRDVVVSEAIYHLLDELEKLERHLSHQDERHSEYSELSDESLYERSFVKEKLVEDAVMDRLLIEQALSIVRTLPLTQAKRFVLRNILGLTFPEIAKLEGCSARAAKDSVDRATEKIRRILN